MSDLMTRRAFMAGMVSAPGAAHAQSSGKGRKRRLSRAEQEQFLLNAKIVRTREASTGITGTRRATMSDGKYSHDASIQTIDIYKTTFETYQGTELNFKDTWKFNVAGYKLDQMLGLNMVPVSVQRQFDGNSGCFTWWVDDVLMAEIDRIKKKITPPNIPAWNDQMGIVRVFDQLIFNTDRNLGNLVIDKQWRIWMIDHGRAFRMMHELREEKNLERCDRDLLAAMKRLDESSLKEQMEDLLNELEIKGLLIRRDRIVEFFEGKGESVLYSSPRRP